MMLSLINFFQRGNIPEKWIQVFKALFDKEECSLAGLVKSAVPSGHLFEQHYEGLGTESDNPGNGRRIDLEFTFRFGATAKSSPRPTKQRQQEKKDMRTTISTACQTNMWASAWRALLCGGSQLLSQNYCNQVSKMVRKCSLTMPDLIAVIQMFLTAPKRRI